MFSKMKKLLTALLAMAMVITSLNAAPMTVSAAAKAVQKVEITKPDSTVLVLKKGKTYKLKAKATPAKASQKFTYKSSKKSVVTVDSKGKLKAKKKGTAKITVTSKAKKSKKDTIKVIVGTPVTKVTLSSTAAALKVGETQTLKATLSPKKPSYKKVKWTSSDETVAAVSSAGVVTAKAAGTAVITVKADDGSGKKATCTVTVEKPADTTPAPAPTPDPNPTPTPTPTPTPDPDQTPVSLSALEIKTAPDKTEYYAGDTADTTGLSVEAVYSDGSKKDVALEDCTLGILSEADGAEAEPIETVLDISAKYIVITYTEGGVTATAKQEITVNPGMISAVTASETAITVANGTSEAAVKAKLAELTLTGNEGSEIGNSAEAWTIEGYAAEKAGNYTAVLSDTSKLEIPEHRVWADEPALPSVTVTVKKVPVTSIQTSAASITVPGGTAEAAIKTELAKLTLKANDAVELANTADLWTIADYDVTKPGKTYTATLDTAKIIMPDNYELSEDIAAVTVSVAVEEIEITKLAASAAEIEVAYTSTSEDVLAKLAALTLTGNDSIAIDNTASAWNCEYEANKSGSYTATLDASKLTLPEGYVLADGVNAVTVTVTSMTIKITAVTASAAKLDVDVTTTEADVKSKLAELTLKGNDDVALTSTADLWTIADYDAATAGSYTATLAVSSLTIPDGYELAEDVEDVTVTVTVVAVTGLEITAQPSKTVYALNSAFDASGMAVTAKYSNDTTKDVTEKVTIEEVTLDEVGKKTVAVAYVENGVTVSANVTITVVSDADYVQQAMTAHYTFDETLENGKSENGTAAMEKYHRGGASETEPTYVEGISGKAVSLAGGTNTDGVKLDAKISSENFTISMWLKPETQTAEYAGAFYAAKNDKHYLAWYTQYNNGFVGMSNAKNNSDRTDTNPVTGMFQAGKWQMVTYTVDGAEGKVYVNGELKTTATQAAGFFSYADDISLYLGTGCIWDNNFKGAYDEVSIYEEALSADQVKALYDQIDLLVTGLSVSSDKIVVAADADENAIKAELAKLTITAALNKNETAPEITNDEDWTLTPVDAGYTAEKEITLPEGYSYAAGVDGKVTVNVLQSAADATPMSVAVKTAPKTEYYAGESFDSTGMELTVTYSDGITKDITEGYTVDLTEALTKDNTKVTVSYKETVGEEEVTVTADLPITVYEKQVVTYSFEDSLDSDADGVAAAKYGTTVTETGTAEASYEDGMSGKALTVGTTQGYGLGTIPAGCGSATISFWIKSSMSAGGGYRPVTALTPNKFNSTGYENWYGIASLGQGTARGNRSYTDGTAERRVNFTNTDSNNVLFNGKWRYVTLVYDGAAEGTAANSIAGTMYVDGEVFGTGDIHNDLITDATEVFLGVTAWTDGGFEGAIDEYSYANYAYTAEEAKEAYESFSDAVHTIKSVSAEKSSLKLTTGTAEDAVKSELAKLALKGTTLTGAEVEVANTADAWTITDYDASSAGEYTAELTASGLSAESYTFADDAKMPSVTVALSATLDSIAITTAPTKTSYVEGDVFDKTGMTVTATYEGGSTADVTADVVISTEPLTTDVTSIEISYTLGEVTKTAAQTIEVKSIADVLTASYAFEDSLANGVDEGAAASLVTQTTLADNTGDAVYEAGVSGQGIVTGTNNELVKLGEKVSGTDFTISFWVKPKALDRQFAAVLFGTNMSSGNRQISLLSDAKNVASDIRTFKGDTEQDVAGVLTVDTWTMLTWVNTNGKVYLYADGKQIMESTSTISGIDNIFLGGCWWDSVFSGVFDEVSIYDGTALSAAAVMKLYNSVNISEGGTEEGTTTE